VPAYAGEDYNVARILRPEERQRGFDEVNLREEDSLELIPDQVLGDKTG
jgi:hypothetical protein